MMATGKRPRRSRRANGDGTITQRKDGLWQAAYFVPEPDGTRKRRYIYGRDRDQVKAKLDELASQVSRGVPVAPAKLTVGEYLEQWLSEIVAKQVRPATYTGYEVNVRRHIKPLIGRRPLARLTVRDVRQMVEALRSKRSEHGGYLSERTVRYVHGTLRAALEHACREEIIPRNVARLVRANVREKFEGQPFTPEEARALLASVTEHRLHAMWVLLILLGLRRGEVLALRWEDVDLDERALRVRRSLQRVGGTLQFLPAKTRGSIRTVPLPRQCVAALRRHRAMQAGERLAAGSQWTEHGLVFATRHGGPIEPRTVNRMFITRCERAGVRTVRLHDLRHGCVSLLLALGVPPRTVMQIVGHTVLGTTMELYGHVNVHDQRAALDLLDQLLARPQETG